jgi:hypothetical protein
VRSLGISWLEPPASRCCTAYIRIITCRIGAIVPGLVGVRLTVIVVVIIWIRAPPRIIMVRGRQSGSGPPPAVAPATPAIVPVALVPAGEAVVQAREAAVETGSVKAAPMVRAGVETAAVKRQIRRRGSVHRGTPSAAVPSAPRAAWARSGWQWTAGPSNAAAMRTTRRLLPGRPLPLRNSRIDNSSLHLAAQGTQATQPAFLSGYVPLTPAAPITLSKFWQIRHREQFDGTSAIRFSAAKRKVAALYEFLLNFTRDGPPHSQICWFEVCPGLSGGVAWESFALR